MASRAAAMLANGMGGIDWAGLPVVCAYLGIQRIEPFLDALEVLITYNPPKHDGDRD